MAVADGTDPQPAHAHLFWTPTVVDLETTRLAFEAGTFHTLIIYSEARVSAGITVSIVRLDEH